MSFLPTRDGDEVGKAQEFAMGELVGGYDEIRTVEWQNGDGSVTRLRTRGGWPIFETEGGGVAKLVWRQVHSKKDRKATGFLLTCLHLGCNTTQIRWLVPMGYSR